MWTQVWPGDKRICSPELLTKSHGSKTVARNHVPSWRRPSRKIEMWPVPVVRTFTPSDPRVAGVVLRGAEVRGPGPAPVRVEVDVLSGRRVLLDELRLLGRGAGERERPADERRDLPIGEPRRTDRPDLVRVHRVEDRL